MHDYTKGLKSEHRACHESHWNQSNELVPEEHAAAPDTSGKLPTYCNTCLSSKILHAHKTNCDIFWFQVFFHFSDCLIGTYQVIAPKVPCFKHPLWITKHSSWPKDVTYSAPRFLPPGHAFFGKNANRWIDGEPTNMPNWVLVWWSAARSWRKRSWGPTPLAGQMQQKSYVPWSFGCRDFLGGWETSHL